METVETVKGPVEVRSLGRTLMHEHCFVLNTEYLQNYGRRSFWDEDERVADAVERLSVLSARGIDSIVDPTVLGLGRDIERVKKVAARVALNIIVATGLYTYHDLPFVYSFRGPGTALGGRDPMIDDFTRDLTDEIADTGVRAALLKCAVEHAEMSSGVERALRAVARTHVSTGAPITVHTSGAEQSGRQALKVLAEEGADLTKVVVGHAGDSTDLGYLMELADTGATLGMDRFGHDFFCADEDRIATVVALCKRGYADRMVLSHDASCFIDWFGRHGPLVDAVMSRMQFGRIPDEVLPELARRGVTEAEVTQMLVVNPARYFA